MMHMKVKNFNVENINKWFHGVTYEIFDGSFDVAVIDAHTTIVYLVFHQPLAMTDEQSALIS